jgi:hypothetical protein
MKLTEILAVYPESHGMCFRLPAQLLFTAASKTPVKALTG